MTPQPPSPTRRTYEAPRIFRVRVAGDELAVAGCKTNSSGGPTGGCLPSGCKTIGS